MRKLSFTDRVENLFNIFERIQDFILQTLFILRIKVVIEQIFYYSREVML